MTTASARAWELRAKLFALVGEFKDLALAISAADAGDDPESDAARQADAAACELAAVHARLSGPSPDWPLFSDAASDRPTYGFPIGGGAARAAEA